MRENAKEKRDLRCRTDESVSLFPTETNRKRQNRGMKPGHETWESRKHGTWKEAFV
jgi:hypothetical protein